MLPITKQDKVQTTLRIAVAMCFIGHGAFGIITKPIWCNYFSVFGIGEAMAYKLMPMLGLFDILLGIVMLVFPIRAIPIWLVIWGVTTALLRPISGEPFAEFIERAGNFGAPLALLLLTNTEDKSINQLFKRIKPNIPVTPEKWKKVIVCLKVVVFLLFVGHGLLNIIAKKSLLAQYSNLGFQNPQSTALLVGIFEIAAACMVLVRPIRPLLFAFFIWKISSELCYPHYEMFEWIERGGSYGAILALWFALDASPSFNNINKFKPSIISFSRKKI